MSDLNPRLNALRPDLADMRLKGRVESPRFVQPVAQQVVVAVADMRRAPRPDSGVDTQVLFGETVDVFEEVEGWCWVQAHSDGYVGYIADTALTSRTHAATHIICAPRTFLYPGSDMKLPAETALSMGSRVSVTGQAETRGTKYLQLATGGAVIANHAMPVSQLLRDPVTVAQSLLHTPYLWGGRSGHGIDCSGLVQLSHALCGIPLQRDTSMQKDSAGNLIDPTITPLRRGDLIFWQAHVAMMQDENSIIHASGHSMDVTIEEYHQALARIGYMYGAPTAYRRVAGIPATP